MKAVQPSAGWAAVCSGAPLTRVCTCALWFYGVWQVNEVEFINAMTAENKRLNLQRRLEDSDQRRRDRLATIIAKQEEKLSKVG